MKPRVRLTYVLQFYQLFDMIAGTSAGALITTALAVKQMSVAQATAFYTKLSKKLFPKRFLSKSLWVALVGPYYSSKPLQSSLQQTFEELRLLDVAQREEGPKVQDHPCSESNTDSSSTTDSSRSS